MKFLFDLFPILVFFIAYLLGGIYTATLATIVASGIQVAIQWIQHKKVERAVLLTFISILLLGGATLLFHNPMLIKWKPTAVYLIFGLGILGARCFKHKSSTQALLGKQAQMADKHWKKLDIAAVCFFLFQAVLNLLVAYNFSTQTWVYYKLFGTMGMTLVFAFVLAYYLYRHAKTPDIIQ